VTPLSVLPPGNQSGEVTVPVSLQVQATGGEPPYLWSATGLPPGLSMNSNGLITGAPLTAGPYTVTVTALDADATPATQTFTWTVVALPTLTNPGTQATVRNTAVSPALQIAHAGGTTPLTWSATGLPPELTISPTTGRITGTPTTARTASPVTVTVTDLHNKSATTTFNWAVIVLPTLTNPGSQVTVRNTAVSPALQIARAGGTAPLSWSATGLPPGLAISPATGAITGIPTTARAASPVTVTVTDLYNKTATTTFTWAVVLPLQIVTPPAQTDRRNRTITPLAVSASGGLLPYTWSATGLPPGLTISSTTGSITGRPTVRALYSVRVTVTDGSGRTATTSTFTWRIT
jgi:hypothetical protein